MKEPNRRDGPSAGDPTATGSGDEVRTCPFCDGSETELMSLFGSHASLTTYWCRSCRSPFEILRWRSQASTRSTSV